ncbi:hypothetical protein [Caldivirga sp.]|uniref:hypothetical protein n=1 Tax=Caldivirga sp. TaxID=2080243 RepID=UPI003D147678
MVEVGYRRLRCPRCGLEEDRDVIAVINLSKMGGTLPTPTARPMTTRARAGTNEPSLRPEKANEETGRRSENSMLTHLI